MLEKKIFKKNKHTRSYIFQKFKVEGNSSKNGGEQQFLKEKKAKEN